MISPLPGWYKPFLMVEGWWCCGNWTKEALGDWRVHLFNISYFFAISFFFSYSYFSFFFQLLFSLTLEHFLLSIFGKLANEQEPFFTELSDKEVPDSGRLTLTSFKFTWCGECSSNKWLSEEEQFVQNGNNGIFLDGEEEIEDF